MEAAPVSVVFAVDEKVLVGDNQHQAYVVRPVRGEDDTVLVRWESTKKEEEVAIGDVKKIDLDAKRQTRGKRREGGFVKDESLNIRLHKVPEGDEVWFKVKTTTKLQKGSGAIDVTQDDDADDDAQRRDTGLSDLRDRKTQERIVEVKKEKADAEGARDRNDAVAAAASTAAATAAADAREAAREAAQELEDVHDDFVNPLTLTVNALQTKIDELHALAYQVDPVAADAIKNRAN